MELIFQRNVIVGWDLDNDLKALCLDKQFKTIDLATHYIDESGQKRKLLDVLAHFEPNKYQRGASAVRDVHIATMEWMKYFPRWQVYPVEISRSAKENYKIDPDDPCWCPKKYINQT